jgi:hypothetical protein
MVPSLDTDLSNRVHVRTNACVHRQALKRFSCYTQANRWRGASRYITPHSIQQTHARSRARVTTPSSSGSSTSIVVMLSCLPACIITALHNSQVPGSVEVGRTASFVPLCDYHHIINHSPGREVRSASSNPHRSFTETWHSGKC